MQNWTKPFHSGSLESRSLSFRPIINWAVKSDKSLWRISGLRLLLAIAFYFAASDTRMPWITLAFAVIFLLSAVLVPVVGTGNMRRLTDWWLARVDYLALPWSLIAIALGVYFMWLGWPATAGGSLNP